MYIVTGAAGFIGSAIVAKLNAEGISEILLVDEPGSSDKQKNLLSLRYLDYFDKDRFLGALAQSSIPSVSNPTEIKAIIHMGACSSTTERNWDYLMKTNVHYTISLADFASAHKIRFVYASSAATYGAGELGYSDSIEQTLKLKPLNLYGQSKQEVDLHLIKTKLLEQCVGLKFFNVYGPNEYHKGSMVSVVKQAFDQVKATGRVRLFRSYRPDYKDGEQKRDFIYVKDCTDLIWWLLRNPKVCGLFNLGTGKARTWNDLARAVFHALGLPEKIEYIDMPPELRGQYQYFTEAKMDKLAATGYPMKFHTLESGVSDYVQSYLNSEDPFLGKVQG